MVTKFDIALVIYPAEVNKKLHLGGLLGDGAGYYKERKCKAFIVLSNIRKSVEISTGWPAEEYLIVKEIVSTIAHETLHKLVHSGRGKRRNRIQREHRAMSRMLKWVDLE